MGLSKTVYANIVMGNAVVFVVGVIVIGLSIAKVFPVLTTHHALAPPRGGWPPFKWLMGCSYYHGLNRNPLCIYGWRNSCIDEHHTDRLDGPCISRQHTLWAAVIYMQGIFVHLTGIVMYCLMLMDLASHNPSHQTVILMRACGVIFLVSTTIHLVMFLYEFNAARVERRREKQQ